jgi:hypothetical protein
MNWHFPEPRQTTFIILSSCRLKITSVLQNILLFTKRGSKDGNVNQVTSENLLADTEQGFHIQGPTPRNPCRVGSKGAPRDSCAHKIDEALDG